MEETTEDWPEPCVRLREEVRMDRTFGSVYATKASGVGLTLPEAIAVTALGRNGVSPTFFQEINRK